jgi:hypothetical protein
MEILSNILTTSWPYIQRCMEDPISLVANLIEIGTFIFLLLTLIRRHLIIRLASIVRRIIVGTYNYLRLLPLAFTQIYHSISKTNYYQLSSIPFMRRQVFIGLAIFTVGSCFFVVPNLKNKTTPKLVAKTEKALPSSKYPPSLKYKDRKAPDQPRLLIPKKSFAKSGHPKDSPKTLQAISGKKIHTSKALEAAKNRAKPINSRTLAKKNTGRKRRGTSRDNLVSDMKTLISPESERTGLVSPERPKRSDLYEILGLERPKPKTGLERMMEILRHK